MMPLDGGEGNGYKCEHMCQPVWQLGVVIGQVPDVALVVPKGRLNRRQVGRVGWQVKQKRTVQLQDLVGDRVLHGGIVLMKHSILRLVFPQNPRHVPVHAPGQACAKGDQIVTALRRRHLVDSQLQNTGVVGDSDN